MKKPFVLVIGHAGAAGEAPANTLAGVRACLDAGAEAMEIDVQLCADGIPVLMHDETVDRTTNLTGRVRDLPLAALQTADAGDGEPVPTLEQVLDLVDGRLTVMCELKATPGDPEHDARAVEAVVGVIRRRGAESWTAIHSFSADIVAHAREAEPRISAAIISPPVAGDGIERLLGGLLKRNAQAISVEHRAITRDLVARARRRQVTVWCWTADSPADWERVVDAGVAGIITNVPHHLRAWLSES
ncbi:glycerophosphodiester phosphodiesterase [Tepidiforma sp.]|uniref:glycerophosphodiester phosphodiesterase n=1 Tax=Tepidiforma sp. TaxID=2682230 RepID=UPI002ADD863D|nr:glycerophosphodiester phosphodiesterase [Tepidiforma sp.]